MLENTEEVSLDCFSLLPLRYSLTFVSPVSHVPYVISFSGLSFFLPLRYSLTFICPVSCVPYVASFSKLSSLSSLRYSRILTGLLKRTIQRNWQHSKTQYTGKPNVREYRRANKRGQSRETIL
jgi:hypothetical protein